MTIHYAHSLCTFIMDFNIQYQLSAVYYHFNSAVCLHLKFKPLLMFKSAKPLKNVKQEFMIKQPQMTSNDLRGH